MEAETANFRPAEALPVAIVGLSIRPLALPNKQHRLALFDCDIGPIRILGCALVKTRGGEHRIATPTTTRSTRTPVALILDRGLRDRIAAAAFGAYQMLAGEVTAC